MKILVCISHVPDTTTKIQFEADGKSLNKAGVTYVINPYDEYGLSRAIGFKEEGKPADITVLTVGGPEVEPTLRKALAIGADHAVRIDSEPLDSFQVAKEIAEYARSQSYDLILTGKESIDFNGGMVPGLIAEFLDLPFVSFASYMEVTGNKALLHREVDGGYEVVETPLPAVVSCQKGIAEWRIPNMRGIMAARQKPLSVEKGVHAPEQVQTQRFTPPPPKDNTRYFNTDQAEALVHTLVEKGII